MKKFLTRTLPLFAALAGSLVATQASAFQFKNCSGVGIRVHVYDEGDVAMVFAKVGDAIAPGQTANWNAGSGAVKARVFQQGIFDDLKLIQNGLQGSGSYSVGINTSDGRWSVVNGIASCN